MSRTFACKKMLSSFEEDKLSFGKSGECQLFFDKNVSKIGTLTLIKKNDIDIDKELLFSQHKVILEKIVEHK